MSTTNPFDKAARITAKVDPPQTLRWLLPRLEASVVFDRWLDTRTLPFPGEPDRTCDTVACLRQQKGTDVVWWAVPIEFQTEPDSEMWGRLLEYLGRLWREYRPTNERGSRFCVVAVLVNLTGTGQTPAEHRLPGMPEVGAGLWPAERNLASEDAVALLTEIEAGRQSRCLLPWISLMRGAGLCLLMTP